MREIAASAITRAVSDLLERVSYDLPKDVEEALNEALARESSGLGREIIRELIKNAEIARKKKMPLCQDTGMAVVYMKIGRDARITGGELREAVNIGVASAYKTLRKSVVSDPFKRDNTGDNTPANLHVEIVPGDGIKIAVLQKGGGGENSSFTKMFLPTASREEIMDFIVERIKENGAKACPPLIVGVGIGGSFDTVADIAKKALLRPVMMHHSGRDNAEMERELLKRINATGIGPMGVGGDITALAVHVETRPCHIASLPLAVNLQCHSHRYKEAVI